MASWVTREQCKNPNKERGGQAWGGLRAWVPGEEQAGQEETRYLQVVPLGDRSPKYLELVGGPSVQKREVRESYT